MNKKSKINVLKTSSLAALVLATAISAGTVSAASGKVTRTSGTDRYQTAAQIAKANWTTSENVVLVSGEGYADAISASTLAKKLNAPIILTTAKTLNSDAKSAIDSLQPKNIYVIGGNASVSKEVRDGLKTNYNVVELGGANRYETNVAVASKLVELGVDPSNVIMVGGEGFSDALSVAPVVASKEQILLLGMNDTNYISPVVNFVKKHNSKAVVVGTSYVINDNVFKTVNGTLRVEGGVNRFDTNLKVLNAFKSDLKMNKLFIANASKDGYADALVASALAGKTASPLVLVDTESSDDTTKAIDYIKANIVSETDLQVIGGAGVVSENLVSKINGVVPQTPQNPTTPETPPANSEKSLTIVSARYYYLLNGMNMKVNDTSLIDKVIIDGKEMPSSSITKTDTAVAISGLSDEPKSVKVIDKSGKEYTVTLSN
ncbi:cell wall-binding repeat-containing protein [Clostridium sp. A1-XYC3]|uniref:Cell wall-binding repeat-containing protein n=1 Tax=Clostridium tanneri TaxID=3037988 RepID=A0ABU4JWN6_9CLOT|nr:cell wall-binding repeat-containing protein [Clostridium sp. A1-XYC3]MDW8802573.1 cell wall-binding repeat-containing protein [Clostridium sp. A1-XYC3]